MKGNVYVEELDGKFVYLTIEADGQEICIATDGEALISTIESYLEASEEVF